jgi:hypothetical protein
MNSRTRSDLRIALTPGCLQKAEAPGSLWSVPRYCTKSQASSKLIEGRHWCSRTAAISRAPLRLRVAAIKAASASGCPSSCPNEIPHAGSVLRQPGLLPRVRESPANIRIAPDPSAPKHIRTAPQGHRETPDHLTAAKARGRNLAKFAAGCEFSNAEGEIL